jgi:hypothetical protein
LGEGESKSRDLGSDRGYRVVIAESEAVANTEMRERHAAIGNAARRDRDAGWKEDRGEREKGCA